MGTISARKIEASLAKARDIGYVEEPFVIGDVSMVMCNLRPDQYSAIYKETEELEDAGHVFGFQKSHICRSIIGINGTDLRGVDYVEVEEQQKDPKTKEPLFDAAGAPVVKLVKLELHEYIRDHILSGWRKEAILVGWRKFLDVIKMAEDKSKEGVKFVLPEETPEETFRRAVATVRESMQGVPEPIIESVLEEAGLMRISTAEEIKKAMAVTDQLARDQEAAARAEQGQEQEPQQPSPQPPQAAPQQPPLAPPPPGARVRQATVEEIMARRQPLNQDAVNVAQPNQEPIMARAPVQAQPVQPPPVEGATAVRAAQQSQRIANVEQDAVNMEIPLPPPGDPTMTQRHVVPGQQQRPVPTTQPNAPHLQTIRPQEVPLLSQKGREHVNMQEFAKHVNQPPKAGINPRFRGPPGR